MSVLLLLAAPISGTFIARKPRILSIATTVKSLYIRHQLMQIIYYRKNDFAETSKNFARSENNFDELLK